MNKWAVRILGALLVLFLIIVLAGLQRQLTAIAQARGVVVH